jgi:hypothetical protein
MVQEAEQRRICQHHITPKLTPALQKYDSTIVAIFSHGQRMNEWNNALKLMVKLIIIVGIHSLAGLAGG